MSAVRTSPLDALHRAARATFTEFSGWSLPLRFSGDLAEHRAVRAHAGLFDISHMGQLAVTGAEAGAALAGALVSDVGCLGVGRARYTMICNRSGGVLDDLIVYRLGDDEFLVIANAGNTGTVLATLTERLDGFAAEITDRTAERALIALQGPGAPDVLALVADGELPRRFRTASMAVAGRPALVTRTGYSGEDGFELSLDRDDAEAVWVAFLAADTGGPVIPAGLAARDSLRLEAALPLYGHELGPDRSPFAAGYGGIVDLGPGRRFVGDDALTAIAAEGEREVLVGLVGEGARAPRQGYAVVTGEQVVGSVTSGGPSPTLGRPIAMAYCVAPAPPPGTTLVVDVRGRPESVTVVDLPFYRRPSPVTKP